MDVVLHRSPKTGRCYKCDEISYRLIRILNPLQFQEYSKIIVSIRPEMPKKVTGRNVRKMLNFNEALRRSVLFGFERPVDKIGDPTNKQVWKNHKIKNPVINTLGCGPRIFTFQHGPAHSALSFCQNRQEKYNQKNKNPQFHN